ncbi:MAG: TlpA family protein disulfide reductase [Nonlabens sp.]|nr:TlpA family protein disulfide reductase [Nonlabens sp.]
MKKCIAIISLFLLATACKEQKSSQEQTYIKNTATITGKITVPKDVPVIDQMMVYKFNEDINDYDEFKGSVDKDGNYKIVVNLDKPKQLMLMGNSQIQFIAVPGDSINLNFEDSGLPGTEAKQIVFSGDRSSTNIALQAYIKDRPLDAVKLQEIYINGTAADLSAYLDTQMPAFTKYVTDFINKNSDDLYLKEYATADKKYGILNTKLTFNAYAGNRGLAATEMVDLTNIEENLPDLTAADFINTSETEQYLYYITSAMRTKTKEALTENSTPEESQKMFLKTIAAIKKNDLLKSKMVYRSTVNDFESNGLTFFENNKEQIKKLITPEQFDKLTTRYDTTKDLLENPKIPASAQLLTFNSDDPTAYLKEIIANANGKVIYIDNWATWCGPCKQEFQAASPALHEKFKEDVEFVYLCHQSERKGYVPSIAKYKIAGIHYFLSQEESAPIFEQIKLQGFPTYTIINKEGEIVISDYTYRPSYPATTDVLTELINE